MENIPETKRCNECGQEKIRSEFYRKKVGGLRPYCKVCSREKAQAYKRDNSQKLRSKAASRTIAEKRAYADRSAAYRRRHRERYRLGDRASCANSRTTPSGKRVQGKIVSSDVRNVLEIQGKRCFYCECDVSEKFDLDHYIPIAKGGTNTPDNLRIACPSCNRKKGNMMPEEFIAKMKGGAESPK